MVDSCVEGGVDLVPDLGLRTRCGMPVVGHFIRRSRRPYIRGWPVRASDFLACRITNLLIVGPRRAQPGLVRRGRQLLPASPAPIARTRACLLPLSRLACQALSGAASCSGGVRSGTARPGFYRAHAAIPRRAGVSRFVRANVDSDSQYNRLRILRLYRDSRDRLRPAGAC